MAYGSKAAEVRRLAREDPTLTKAELARRVGVSAQAVSQALKHIDVELPNGRLAPKRALRRGRARETGLIEARRKMQAGEPLTREERHLLQEDYRRRERERAG